MVRLRAVIVTFALLAVSGLAASVLERIGASLRADVPPGWSASGCLGSAVAPMGVNIVVGQASLCIAEGGVQATLDAAHLAPTASYVEWIAYFESPSLCSFGALVYQIRNFNQPCTLIDLDGSQPHGIARKVADSAADAQGNVHVDGLIREIDLRRRAQAWLLISGPAWSPAAPGSNAPALTDSSEPIARAVFDLP